jgi:DNA repair photolyase
VWWSQEEEPSSVEATVTPDDTKTILATNDSPDVPFDTSVNPYRGCEHGCTYCFARVTHSYLGLSPGLDFETRIVAKPRAAELLEKELARPGYRCGAVVLGSNTDPYQPVEKKLGITRSVLEVLARHRNPVCIATKSALVLRDLDILVPMAEQGLAAVTVSITTLDRDLSHRMEPRAASPGRRIRVLRELVRAGVPAGVLNSPLIPGLNDHEMESILEAASGTGAQTANYILLRLPHELKRIFGEWLERTYPARAAKVLSRLRAMHGGELYDSSPGTRGRGTGPWADLLRQRFAVACRRLGLREREIPLRTDLFRVPGRGRQGTLFDDAPGG